MRFHVKAVYLPLTILTLAWPSGGLAQGQGEAEKKPFSLDDFSKMSVVEKRGLFGDRLEKLKEKHRLFELLMLGMQDPDSTVQKSAIQNVGLFLPALQEARRESRGTPLDLSNIGEIQQLLIARLSSPDAYIRQAAVLALVQTGAPNPQTEDVLLKQYWREPEVHARAAVIDAMNRAGYDSPAYIQLVLHSLVSPDVALRDAALRAVVALKPPAALPLMEPLIKRTPGLVVDALAAYGAQARAYLPLLQSLLADPNVQKSAGMLERVRAAIGAIQNPKPQPEAPRGWR